MDENNDVNTRINFWVNVKRYLALKDISNATLAKRIKSSEPVVVKLMEKESVSQEHTWKKMPVN